MDDDKVFIGSYNIDPRSANINTELGVLITDPLLAKEFHQSVGQNILPQAYQVTLAEIPRPLSVQETVGQIQMHQIRPVTQSPTLVWKTINTATAPLPQQTTREPKISFLNKSWLWLFGKLPIERYL